MNNTCNLNAALFEGLDVDSSPYQRALLTCTTVSTLVFVISTITNNVSQVDKLWSIIPFIYTWMAVCDGRTFLMAIIATIWGLRLSWNFYRRGGYSWPPWNGEEDYRWEQIRQGHYVKILQNPIVWHIFNLVFISFYQNFLLLWITTPSFVAYTIATNAACMETYIPLNAKDFFLASLILCFIAVETIADNQQYAFQTEKYRRIAAGIKLDGAYEHGFCQSGLFSILRKPNYAAEQLIWVSFYFFPVVASGGRRWFNWTIYGWLLLLLLFQGSGALTEKLTVMKYPKYKEYQKCVPLYVPNLFALFKRASTTAMGGNKSKLN